MKIVTARLPHMSEHMLQRVFSDRVARLSLGFSVEVAVGAHTVELDQAPESFPIALDFLADKFMQIEKDPDLTTNDDTNLRCRLGKWRGYYDLSNQPGHIDILKLLLFMEDQYILSTFAPLYHDYVTSMLADLQQAIEGDQLARDTRAVNVFIEKMNSVLFDARDQYPSLNLNRLADEGMVEFVVVTSGEFHRRFPDVRSAVMRLAELCVVASSPDLYRREYLTMIYRLVAQVVRPKADEQLEKQVGPLFTAFVRQNAGALFGSRFKPDLGGWTVWNVAELPGKLTEFLNTPDMNSSNLAAAARQRVFFWIVDVLSRANVAQDVREKIVTYVLCRLNRTARKGEYDADDYLRDGNALTLWPWLTNVKSVI